MSLSLLAMLLPMIGALKLTPVPQLTQRVDLASEARSTSIAVNTAIYKFEEFEASSGSNLKEFLESAEVQKLSTVIRRWSYIEERLKISMANGPSQQTQQFEDVQHNIASIKALIGQALYRDKEEKISLAELELSCPTLWRLKSSWRSVVHDGWLDCYSTIGEMYLNRKMPEDAKIIADKLIRSLPWIRNVLKMSDTEQPIEVLKAFIALTPEDRKHIALEVKGAWTFADGIRGSFKLLIEDFMVSESARKRQTIFARAKRVTEEILQQYSVEELGTSTEVVTSLSSINVEILRRKLYEEIKRETDLFLSGLQGFINSGDDYLKEMKQNDLSSTLKTSFETLTAVLESGNELSWAQVHASELMEDTSGFHSLREVIQVFEDAIEKSKVTRLEEYDRVKRQTKAQQNRESSKSSSSSGKSQKSEKTKRSKTTGSTNPRSSSSSSGSYNETFEKQSSEKQIEDLSWATFLFECLWNLLLSGGVLSLVSVAGGHYLRSSTATNKQPNRTSKVYAKPPNAFGARRRLNSNGSGSGNIVSSVLVPPPKFDQVEESEASPIVTPWWMNMIEDSKLFWLECYSFIISVLKSVGDSILLIFGMIQSKLESKKNEVNSDYEFANDSLTNKRKLSHGKRRTHSETALNSIEVDKDEQGIVPVGQFVSNDFASEFVQFDLSASNESKPSKSKNSNQVKKKKAQSAKSSSVKNEQRTVKPEIERSPSKDSENSEKQEMPVEDKSLQVEAASLKESDDNEVEHESLGEEEQLPVVSSDSVSNDLTLDPFYYDENYRFEDDGEWIEAGGKKSSHHSNHSQPIKKSTTPSSSSSAHAPSSPDRHYLQMREQRMQKELQRRKAYETAFIKGKLDHAPKGLKKAPQSTTSTKPVVGLNTSNGTTTQHSMNKNQLLKDMLQSFPSLAAGNKTNPSSSAQNLSDHANTMTNLSKEEQEKNRQQFMNMMYTLLDRHNHSVNKIPQQPSASQPSASNLHDDADGEHLSLTDTENSDDHYGLDRGMIFPPEAFMVDGHPINATEEDLNKFYSIMNAYYYYQATESLIPGNIQHSSSPDLLDSPTQPIPMPLPFSGSHDNPMNVDRAPSFDNTAPLFMPPPLIPVTPAAVAEVNRVGLSAPPPAPPLLIPPPPPLTTMPPLTPSPTHAGGFPLPPEFAAMLPPMLPINMPPMMFPPFNMMPPPPTHMPPPASMFPSPRNNLFEATKRQVEYYFSKANLERDMYLRKLMDEEGFVPLLIIAKFPRMMNMNVPADMLLAVVRTSPLLEVKNQFLEDNKLSSDQLIESTFIRCKQNPTQWVLHSEES